MLLVSGNCKCLGCELKPEWSKPGALRYHGDFWPLASWDLTFQIGAMLPEISSVGVSNWWPESCVQGGLWPAYFGQREREDPALSPELPLWLSKNMHEE